MSSFVALDFPTSTGSNLLKFSTNVLSDLALKFPEEAQERIYKSVPALTKPHQEVRYSTYCGLAPVVVFVAYVLGPRLATISVGLFLLSGLLGPVFGFYPFASGGGLDYYLQPGFGYLIGLLASAYICGKLTRNKRTSLSQVVGLSAGILAMHLIGAGYLFGAYLYFYLVEGSKTYLEWQPWIFGYLRNLTWYALPYDFALSILLVGVAFPFRWLAKHLMAPDVGPPPNQVRSSRQQLKELV